MSAKRLSTALNTLWKKKEAMDEAKRDYEKKKKAFNAEKDKVIAQFKKADLDGARGSFCQVKLGERTIPRIKDPQKFSNYVIRNRATDLFQNRLSQQAVFDRLEAGKKIPGIEIYEEPVLYISKVKG